jgi:hypothetical protein
MTFLDTKRPLELAFTRLFANTLLQDALMGGFIVFRLLDNLFRVLQKSFRLFKNFFRVPIIFFHLSDKSFRVLEKFFRLSENSFRVLQK